MTNNPFLTNVIPSVRRRMSPTTARRRRRRDSHGNLISSESSIPSQTSCCSFIVGFMIIFTAISLFQRMHTQDYNFLFLRMTKLFATRQQLMQEHDFFDPGDLDDPHTDVFYKVYPQPSMIDAKRIPNESKVNPLHEGEGSCDVKDMVRLNQSFLTLIDTSDSKIEHGPQSKERFKISSDILMQYFGEDVDQESRLSNYPLLLQQTDDSISDAKGYAPIENFHWGQAVQYDGLEPSTFDTDFMRALKGLNGPIPQIDETTAAIKAYADLEPIHKPHLLVIVCTFSSHTELTYRYKVRETWGLSAKKLEYPRVRVIFPIGTKGLSSEVTASLEAENDQFRDLLLIHDFQETYRGLSDKMLQLYKYIYAHRDTDFEHTKWMIKTDTDAWLHMGNLAEFMVKTKAERMFTGYVYESPLTTAGIWRNLDYVSRCYPPYMAGAGYLMSSDIMFWLARNAAEGWLNAFPNEDANTGIWLAGTTTVLKHDSRFNPMHRGFWRKIYVSADVGKDMLLTHNLSPRGLVNMHMRYKDYDAWLLQHEAQLRSWYGLPPAA